jgi:hypothetical protein
LEEQRHQSQQILERFAGGIAHDMNNYLSAIWGFADSALGKLPPNSGARDDLERIKDASDRAMETFSGPFLDNSSRRIGEDALEQAEILEGPTFRLTDLNFLDPCPMAPDQKPIWRAGYAWLCPEPDDPAVWLLWRYLPTVDQWTRIPIRTPRKWQATRIAGWICGD